MCIRVAKQMKRIPQPRKSRSASKALEQKSSSAGGRRQEKRVRGIGQALGEENRKEPCPRKWAGRARGALPGLWNRSPRTSTS